jgi:hypothetical protein
MILSYSTSHTILNKEKLDIHTQHKQSGALNPSSLIISKAIRLTEAECSIFSLSFLDFFERINI